MAWVEPTRCLGGHHDGSDISGRHKHPKPGADCLRGLPGSCGGELHCPGVGRQGHIQGCPCAALEFGRAVELVGWDCHSGCPESRGIPRVANTLPLWMDGAPKSGAWRARW